MLGVVASEINPAGCQRSQPLSVATLFCACVVSANSAAFLRVLSPSGLFQPWVNSKADPPCGREEPLESAGKKTIAEVCRML